MTDTRNEDRRYLSAPSLWVTWPMVPVKTIDRGLNREIGVIIEESRTVGWQVYMTNLFKFDPNAPVKVYATLDALLDVWMVD
jgi:hypothetical protein